MATRDDGRIVPDFEDIGVMASGGGTRNVTRAGQAELTRQRTANMSFPTRALGIALGAAETIVPAVGSPKETLRTLAKAARDYIVTGQDKSLPGFATLGAARTALTAGFETGTAAAAGDPKAQGAALAAVGGAALAARSAIYGRAANAVSPRVAVDLTPSPKPLADPLDVPAFQRGAAPVRPRFATDAEVRAANLERARTTRQHPERGGLVGGIEPGTISLGELSDRVTLAETAARAHERVVGSLSDFELRSHLKEHVAARQRATPDALPSINENIIRLRVEIARRKHG